MQPAIRPPASRIVILLAGGAAAAALAVAPRPADACSGTCVSRGHFVPGDGATVPANLPAIYWRPRGDAASPSPAMVTLATAAAPGTPLAFTASQVGERDYLLVPDEPLVAGTQYVLTDGNACADSATDAGPTATFTVGPSAPLPNDLGTLAVTDLPARVTSIATNGGGCSTDATVISATVAVDFESAPGAAPWRDVLHYQTLVDGDPWQPRASLFQSVAPGASWEGRGFDRIFAVCRLEGAFPQSPSYDLPTGGHTVEIRATLPGDDLVISTPRRLVTLACPAVLPPDGDAGTDGGNDGGDEGGCCSSTTHPGGAAGLALLVALALGGRRRPPRRRPVPGR